MPVDETEVGYGDRIQKYQQQLKGFDVFRETDVPLTPSTKEYLFKNIDTSSDVNPLDFICEHLQ